MIRMSSLTCAIKSSFKISELKVAPDLLEGISVSMSSLSYKQFYNNTHGDVSHFCVKCLLMLKMGVLNFLYSNNGNGLFGWSMKDV